MGRGGEGLGEVTVTATQHTVRHRYPRRKFDDTGARSSLVDHDNLESSAAGMFIRYDSIQEVAGMSRCGN